MTGGERARTWLAGTIRQRRLTDGTDTTGVGRVRARLCRRYRQASGGAIEREGGREGGRGREGRGGKEEVGRVGPGRVEVGGLSCTVLLQ